MRPLVRRLVLGGEACGHCWRVVAKAATEIGLSHAPVCLVAPRPDLRQRLLVLIQRERHRLGQRQACVAVVDQLLCTPWTMAPTGRLYDGRIALGIVRGEGRAA